MAAILLTTYVIGYWKTDHNVTLGQLHFIGPANSYTHALSMYHCIIGLSQLVCFSRVGFAYRVKSRLRQWDPWSALDGRYGSDIHPCVGETSLKALQSCLGLRMICTSWTHSYVLQTVQLEAITCLQLPTRPLHPPAPSIHPTRPLH